MTNLMKWLPWFVCLALEPAAFGLTVESDFEGASVRVLQTDDATRTIRFMPGGDPARGWPCWWHFRVSKLTARESLTLELVASDALMPQANGQASDKPLPAGWAMPERASFSQDSGRTWQRTAPGRKQDGRIIYTLNPDGPTVLVAWGPPYTPASAATFVRETAAGVPSAKEMELCRSREGRSVPMLRVCEGDRPETQRFGVWVQARQHAWESGSSWVAQGFAEWLLERGSSEAAWLRQHAEIFIVPIMDVDNTATGNGGKEACRRITIATGRTSRTGTKSPPRRRAISELVKRGRMDLFLDLHNPGAGRLEAVFLRAPPGSIWRANRRANQAAFLQIARERNRAGRCRCSGSSSRYGPNYHPLWRQIELHLGKCPRQSADRRHLPGDTLEYRAQHRGRLQGRRRRARQSGATLFGCQAIARSRLRRR